MSEMIDGLKDENGQLDHNSIKQIIPYDYPFLMIDRVILLQKDKIMAIKNVTINEHFFKGHFAGFPIMPGAMMIEGMGQAATLLARYNLENHHEKECLAFKIKDAKFIKPVFPGDQMRFEVALQGMNEKGAAVAGKVIVNEAVVAEAMMMIAVVDRQSFRAKYSGMFK